MDLLIPLVHPSPTNINNWMFIHFQMFCEKILDIQGIKYEKRKMGMSPGAMEYLRLGDFTKPKGDVQYYIKGLKYLNPGHGLNVRWA